MTSDTTRWLTDDTALIDLRFQGVPHVIAAYLLRTGDGLAVVETGPGSTIDHLREGVRALGHAPGEIRHLLVTHIHLDHAGAAGQLLRELPEARLYVSEVGAPHLVDPSKLIASATRIYGEQMDALWGALLPVPPERMTVVRDGDRLDLGRRRLDVLATPGHASHHVVYHDPERRTVFAGDVAGNAITPARTAVPPTPPPDINVELWHASIARLRALAPEQLLLAHFGPVADVGAHLADLDARLDEHVALVAGWLRDGLERDEMVRRLSEHIHAQVRDAGGGDDERALALAAPAGMSLDGLARYIRKRGEAGAPSA